MIKDKSRVYGFGSLFYYLMNGDEELAKIQGRNKRKKLKSQEKK